MIDPALLQFEDCVTLDSGRPAVVHDHAVQYDSGCWFIWVWVWGTKLERVALNKIVKAERAGEVLYGRHAET